MLNLSLTQVDEIMRLNGERENVGHSNKGGPQKNKEAEDDSLKFFPSSYQHTDSDITDMSDVSGVQPTDHTLSSMCTQECCEKDTDTTEVSMWCDSYKQKNVKKESSTTYCMMKGTLII